MNKGTEKWMYGKIRGILSRYNKGSRCKVELGDNPELALHSLWRLKDKGNIDFVLSDRMTAKVRILKALKRKEAAKKIKLLKYKKSFISSNSFYNETASLGKWRTHYYLMEDENGIAYRVPPKKLVGLDLKEWIEVVCKTEGRKITWIYSAVNVIK